MGLTSLAYLMDIEWLREAYRRTRKDGATGVDGQTAADYEQSLESNLQTLLDRAKSGRYIAPPVKRVHIPKGGSKTKTRPIGIPTLEDRLRYIRATDVNGDEWGTPYTVSDLYTGGSASLTVVNGYPAMCCFEWGTAGPAYWRADDANGDTWGSKVKPTSVSSGKRVHISRGCQRQARCERCGGCGPGPVLRAGGGR